MSRSLLFCLHTQLCVLLLIGFSSELRADLIPAGDVPVQEETVHEEPVHEETEKEGEPADKAAAATAEEKKQDADVATTTGDDESEEADDESDASAKESDEEEESAEEKQAKKADKETKKEDEKAEPHEVEEKPLKIEAKLEGVFVSNEMEEVALRPESWTQFKVLEAVEHGTHVKKGEVLIRFDPEKLEDQLSEQAQTLRLGELSLMLHEEEYPREKRLLEIAYEQAKRRYERLQADFEYYESTDRPFAVNIAMYRYKSAQEDLASQREELEQLVKMYEADELTEETEEIVLRRQRFEVETAELVLELQAADREYTMEVQLPRTDESYKVALEEANLSFEKAKTAKELGTTRMTYELEKLRDARARAVERHAKLVSDKSLMEIRSPTDGVVYYGKCTAGKWSQVGSLQSKFVPFGSASPNSVLMTIVKEDGLYAESKIAEKELPDFHTGQSGTISPAGDEEVELPVKVTKLGTIPEAGNKFSIHLEVDTADAPEWLVAGMTGTAMITVYENEAAVVVPEELVQSDKENEKIKYVMLVEDDEEEPVRRTVKLGRKKDKLVEVLKGLEAGDKIVKEEKKDDE